MVGICTNNEYEEVTIKGEKKLYDLTMRNDQTLISVWISRVNYDFVELDIAPRMTPPIPISPIPCIGEGSMFLNLIWSV